MAAAAPSDRLSDLPDDLLIHVLSFAPSREAARTTALSRRWRRPLWLHTAALNLDYRSYAATTTTTPGAVPLSCRAMDDADHAIAFQNSVGRVPTKVAVVMHDNILSQQGRRRRRG
ncbi:putative F-box/LRR-repeat protein [Hordeum vulgare]|nr:putative F-box/LRR-repeat protein [Hordeum vulgare]